MIQNYKSFFIGIDSSSTHTAIVILNEKGGLNSFFLIEPQNKDLRERGQIIYNEVIRIVNQFNPFKTKIILESPALMAKGKVVDLAMIVGSIYYSLGQFYEIKLVPPTTLKKFFTKNGKATKKDMINNCPEFLLKKFKEKYKKIDDLVDAYALALYGMLN